MLQILYLLLEGFSVIVPILLAVAMTPKLNKTFRKNKKSSIFNFNFFYFILFLFLFIIFNSYLISIIFPNTKIYSFFIYFNINTIPLISNFIITFLIICLFDFLDFIKNLFLYTMTLHLDTVLLSIIVPIGAENKKELNNNKYSTTQPTITKINPWFITGFSDAESSFHFSICKSKSSTIGWQIAIGFNLVAKNNPANVSMFNEIQKFFGFGKIIFAKDSSFIRLIINGVPNCLLLREHFISYPLMSYKLVHFQLWSRVLDLLVAKEHLTLKGLLKIVAIKAHFPLGLSPLLQTNFSNYTAIEIPVYEPILENLNVHWLAGFINGDGSFGLHIEKPFFCRFRIMISQHVRSLILIEGIQKFLGLGKISISANNPGTIVNIKIHSLEEVNKFIIMFQEAKLMGAKELDYIDFCKGIELINEKKHLTESGKAEYAKLVDSMNSTRTCFISK